MSELPNSWVDAPLGDISGVEMGQSPDSRFYNDRGEGLPFFQGKAEFGALYPAVRKWCSEPTKIAEAGDILLSVRAPVGPTNLAEEKCCIGRGLAAIRADEPIRQKYLLHYFRHIQPWLSEQGTGTTFTAVSGDFLRALKVTVAPTNEQKRIADKLDAALARVDACRARLDRVPAILKRFRQAVLAAATSGKLTEEWRGGREADWVPHKLGNIARFIDYRGKTPTKTESGIPLITAKNIRPGYVAMEPREYIADDAYKGWMTRGIPRIGDVLITTEAPLGNVAVIDWEFKFALAQRVICLQFQNDISVGRFAAIALQSPAFQFTLGEQSTGTTVAGIKASRLKELEIVLPSIDEQHEIVRRVEALLAYADRLESRYSAARAQVERLTPALLAKAFRGELVPQDSNDEPASVLLERIRTARAATGKKPPRQVRTERKSMTTKLTTDTLKGIIRGLPNDRFTFDDLRGQVSADYETLKEMVFALLSEAPASVKQVFDEEAKTMQLVRVKR